RDHRLEHRPALRAVDRALVQIIELGAAIAAEALGAELGFRHGPFPRNTIGKKWAFPCPYWRGDVNSSAGDLMRPSDGWPSRVPQALARPRLDPVRERYPVSLRYFRPPA